MKILTFIADGTEDSELITTLDILKRGGIDYHIISCSKKNTELSHKINIIADDVIDNHSLQSLMDYDGLFFPGGKRGTDIVKSNKLVLDLISQYELRKKPIMAICAAPTILGKAGIMNGVNFTCYDGFEKDVVGGIYHKGAPLVRDKNIITGRSAGYTIEFALEIVEYLKGKDERDNVSKKLLLEV